MKDSVVWCLDCRGQPGGWLLLASINLKVSLRRNFIALLAKIVVLHAALWLSVGWVERSDTHRLFGT
ncbi:MAG: hypothetical protein WAW87_08195 [Candidatus Ferrigenium altingense]